ncbi:unnamed protein product, partial [Brenthis ino]
MYSFFKFQKVSFIKPCKADDNACLLSSSQGAVPYMAAGIPELGIPPSDPLYINEVRSDDRNLKLGFRNVKVVGISKAKIISISRDVKEHTIKLVIETPLSGTGQYDLDGHILILHATGNGDFDISTEKAIINIVCRLKTIEKGGKKYWKITGYDYNYDLVKKVYIKLHNLFGGDEKKAKPFHELLDRSWKEIVYEIGGPMLKDMAAQFLEHVKKFLLVVPVNEIEIV